MSVNVRYAVPSMAASRASGPTPVPLKTSSYSPIECVKPSGERVETDGEDNDLARTRPSTAVTAVCETGWLGEPVAPVF